MVDTESEAARETRRFVLTMLLTDHPNDCMTCEVNGDCELQDLVYDYDVAWPEHGGFRHSYEIDPDPNPFILIDRNKCILCGRCVRACSEIQCRDVVELCLSRLRDKAGRRSRSADAGGQLRVVRAVRGLLPGGRAVRQDEHGQGRANQVTKVRTTCTYCGVGCQFDLNVKDGASSASPAPRRAGQRHGTVRQGALRLRLCPPP